MIPNRKASLSGVVLLLLLSIVGAVAVSATLPAPQLGLYGPDGRGQKAAPQPAIARQTADNPLSLAFDDGTAEGALGVTDVNRVMGTQAVFLNRFTLAANQLPFTLDTVSILFPVSTPQGPTRIVPGSAYDVLIYVDPAATGDPKNATFKFKQSFTVQPSNSAFQDIRVGLPIVVQTGDLWVGFTNTVTATDHRAVFCAALDTNTNLGRSWAFFNRQNGNDFGGGPLDGAEVAQTVGGNWMIRAVGQIGGATCVRWDPPSQGLAQGGPPPPPSNTRLCDSVPPATKEGQRAPRDVLMGYNVYRSNQPGVQPTPGNLFTSVPPTTTNVGSSVSPSGSFFVITAMYDTGESGPSNEIAIVPPTITKIKVTATKIDARGSNFTTSAQIFIDGIPFATTAVVKKSGARVVQKGNLITGQTIGQYLATHGNRARVDIRNSVGAFAQVNVP